MRKYFYKFYVVFLIVLTASQLKAQERIVHGVVTTFDSISVCGATVKVQSTKQTTLTDTLGNFSIGCNKKDKLKVLAKGFFTQTVKLEEKTKFAAVNLRLKPGDKNKDFAIGYTKVTDREKLNALASLNNKDVDFSQYRNMFEAISGRIVGVQIVNGEIIIRGNNTINGTSPALIVVDGTPINANMLNAMNPAQVKRIDVIKDGSSAIYGSRGANGVIVIETKSGGD